MVNINFSKESTTDLLDDKQAQISALRNDREKMIDLLKRLIEFAENPRYSEDDQSAEFLTDGEMLDIVLDQLKNLTAIKHRLNAPKS